MRSWPRLAIRAFGVTSILLAMFGMLLNATSILHFIKTVSRAGEPPFYVETLYASATVDSLSNVILFVAGIMLVRLARPGLVICNVLFSFQIACFLAGFVMTITLWDSPGIMGDITRNLGSVSGIAHLGTTPQFIVGYPIIGLILLNVAFRKLKGTTGQRPGSR